MSHVILNEWQKLFIARIINIHGSGVLIALFGCCMAGATWNADVSAQVLSTPFNHTAVYSVTLFKATDIRCMAINRHLHFWQNNRYLLHATVKTGGGGYQNKSQHRKLTLENKILVKLGWGHKKTCSLHGWLSVTGGLHSVLQYELYTVQTL